MKEHEEIVETLQQLIYDADMQKDSALSGNLTHVFAEKVFDSVKS